MRYLIQRLQEAAEPKVSPQDEIRALYRELEKIDSRAYAEQTVFEDKWKKKIKDITKKYPKLHGEKLLKAFKPDERKVWNAYIKGREKISDAFEKERDDIRDKIAAINKAETDAYEARMADSPWR
jgi:hypothetical protein